MRGLPERRNAVQATKFYSWKPPFFEFNKFFTPWKLPVIRYNSWLIFEIFENWLGQKNKFSASKIGFYLEPLYYIGVWSFEPLSSKIKSIFKMLSLGNPRKFSTQNYIIKKQFSWRIANSQKQWKLSPLKISRYTVC